MAVGAPFEDTNGYDAGAVDVYRFTPRPGAWQFHSSSSSRADPETYAHFGSAVAVDGDLLVVGAPLKDTTQGVDAGQIYVFRYNAGTSTWAQEQKLLPSVGIASDHFGSAVAVSGNLALAGSPLADTTLGVDSAPSFAYRYKNSFSSGSRRSCCSTTTAPPTTTPGRRSRSTARRR
jgi:hypothetical protein